MGFELCQARTEPNAAPDTLIPLTLALVPTYLRAPVKRVLAALIILVSTFVFFAGQRRNPPGFYIDESSVAWNALTIAHHGTDQYGTPHPLFFKAFGEYKNPVFIYILAGVFKVLTPSNLIARRTAAILLYLAAIVLAWLARQITGSRSIALTTFLTALATPMLFETSRLAFEVAVMPLATALLLSASWRSSRREVWNWSDVATLASSLTLFSYSYTSGRLLGPLFAVVLAALMFSPRRALPIAATLIIFGTTTILPMTLYNARHQGALTERARSVSYFRYWDFDHHDVIRTLEQNIASNLLPLGMTLSGDPNERHHVQHGAGGGIFGMTFLLAGASLMILAQPRPVDRWWLFVIFATVASVIPAAITAEVFHTFRLITYPVFLIVLSLPVLAEPRYRSFAAGALLLGVVQAAWFSAHFQRWGPLREQAYDVGVREVMRAAAAQPIRPIFYSATIDVHALWFGHLAGVKPRELEMIDVSHQPSDSVIVAPAAEAHDEARVLAQKNDYVCYVSK